MGAVVGGQGEGNMEGIANTKGPVKSYMEIYLFPKYIYIYKRSLNGVNQYNGEQYPNYTL